MIAAAQTVSLRVGEDDAVSDGGNTRLIAIEGRSPGECDDRPLDDRVVVQPSEAEEVTAGMDLAGRTAFITGCNSGLGYEIPVVGHIKILL